MDSEYLPVTDLKNNLQKQPNIIKNNNNYNYGIDNNNIVDNYNSDGENVLTNNPLFNEITNSNMNINVNNNLFNFDQKYNFDIFPEYQRPSLGNDNNLNI